MNLSDCKFYHGGEDMNFSVFSDYPCRTRYIESISTPLTQTPVDVYEIEPGSSTQWIVIQQKDGDERRLKFFMCKEDGFLEDQVQQIPPELKRSIFLRFPILSTGFEPPMAA
jgi:hypothetical protein